MAGHWTFSATRAQLSMEEKQLLSTLRQSWQEPLQACIFDTPSYRVQVDYNDGSQNEVATQGEGNECPTPPWLANAPFEAIDRLLGCVPIYLLASGTIDDPLLISSAWRCSNERKISPITAPDTTYGTIRVVPTETSFGLEIELGSQDDTLELVVRDPTTQAILATGFRVDPTRIRLDIIDATATELAFEIRGAPQLSAAAQLQVVQL